MDLEGRPALDWDHPFDCIPVSQLATEINELIIVSVESVVHSNERVPASMLQPMLKRIRLEYFSAGTIYALLASRLHFQQEMNADAAAAKLWRTRWQCCEELALRLIPYFLPQEFAQNLVFEFYPLADGSPLGIVPTWLRVSALELAIKSEAKRLLAHPVCVNVVTDLWDGHLVLDPLVHKVHRSDALRSPADLDRLMNARRGVVVRYDFEETTIFKPSRLRVPKYREWLKLLNLGIIITLYVLTMGPSSSTIIEGLFQVWVIAFIIDELNVLRSVGSHLFFLSLWSMCDIVTIILCTMYLMLKVAAYIVAESEASTRSIWNDKSYDILAVCGVTLIPRMFSVLEASVGFSRTVISVRKMVTELLWCWIAITMFSVGFWAALAHFGKGVFTRSEVFYDLLQVLFGFTPAVWTSWHKYPTPGALILFLYLFMAQFVVTTMVTAALSAKIIASKDSSLEEYHFLNAVRTEVRIKSERQVLYFYSEPWVILCFFPLPLLRHIIPTAWYLQTNRFLLKLTHWHIFLAIYVYERLSSAIIARQSKAAEEQHQRVRKHVQRRMRKTPRQRGRWVTTNAGMQTSNLDQQQQQQQQQQPLFPRRMPNLHQSQNQYQKQRQNQDHFQDHFSNQYQDRYHDQDQNQDQQTLATEGGVTKGINNGSLRETKFDIVEELLHSPSLTASAPAGSTSRVPSVGTWPRQPPAASSAPSHRWSFDSERETPSIFNEPLEDISDLHEWMRELHQSNTRIEGMLERLLGQK